MIKIRNLKKTYNNQVILNDINIDIDKKDIFGIIGVSGSGKSTLLRCINGLEKVDSGKIIIDGTELHKLEETSLRKFRKNIGMVFQHFSLLDTATVYENVALPLKAWGYNKSKIKKKVLNLIDLVELNDKIDAKPRSLSGGQKQRVAIARSLALNPEILLCDEATSALDPNTTESILDLLIKINKELDLTIVFVTHQMEVIKKVANKMIVLGDGKIQSVGTVKETFMNKPKILFEVLGEQSFFDKELEKDKSFYEIVCETEEDGYIFSKISGVNFKLEWGGFEKYRKDKMGIFIVSINNIDSDDFELILDKSTIEKWRKLN